MTAKRSPTIPTSLYSSLGPRAIGGPSPAPRIRSPPAGGYYANLLANLPCQLILMCQRSPYGPPGPPRGANSTECKIVSNPSRAGPLLNGNSKFHGVSSQYCALVPPSVPPAGGANSAYFFLLFDIFI